MSNLNRFQQAQDDFGTYNRALQEMKAILREEIKGRNI